LDGPGKFAVSDINSIDFSLRVTEENFISGHATRMEDCAGRFKRPDILAGSVIYRMQCTCHRADEDFPVHNNRLDAGHQALIGK